MLIVLSPSTSTHAGQFLDVMKAYQSSHQDSKVKSLDLSGTHSWDEVMAVVRLTERTYFAAGRRGSRRVGRIISDQAESVLPALRLIPNGTYTSIACGGLKLVFELSSALSMTGVRPLTLNIGRFANW